jgi:hypothetical protein
MIKKAIEILIKEGTSSLVTKSIQSLKFRIRSRKLQRTYSKIDRIAGSNIATSRKFSLIYQKQLWLKAMPHLNEDRTLSGHGSTRLSTTVFRRNLEMFLHEMGVKRFLDAPCGDFNWMRHVNLPEDCYYIGGDIVPHLVAWLKEEYGSNAPPRSCGPRRRQFICMDLTKDNFPEADVWLCRDCLQHLSNVDIGLVLDNFRHSQINIALISNHIDVNCNVDIVTGQFRHVDLTRAPFNLPPPRRKLLDVPVDAERRYIGVWYKEDLVAR